MATTDRPISPQSGHRRLALGALAGGGVNVFKILLQLALLPVMARLLGPSEFGLYGLALPTVSLITLLADGGLGATLAREKETNTLVWSSAFWALIFIGLALAAGCTAIGFLIGRLTDQPRLPGLIALLSVSLIFLTQCVVPGSRLVRGKRLGIMALADLSSNIVGSIIAVAMAWNGAGAWSLAAQYITVFFVRSIVFNLAAFQPPEWKFDWKSLKPHVVSGGYLIVSRIFEYSGRAAENFIVDRGFGTALLGSYNFSNQVSKFLTDAASNVSWSAIYVQALNEKRSQVVVLHRQLCRLLGVLLLPSTFIAAAAAPELVDWVLGPKWPDLPFLLRVLLPLYALSAIFSQASPLLLAYGRFDIQLWNMAGLSAGRVAAVCLGLWFGIEGVAYGLIVVTLAYCVSLMITSSKATGCDFFDVLSGLVRPAVATVIATAAFFILHTRTEEHIVATLLSAGISFIIYLAILALIDRKGLEEDWNSANRILRPAKPVN